MWMRKRRTFATAALLTLTLSIGSTVNAFSDIKDDPNREAILSLQQAGVVNGVTDELFAPKGTVTMAQGVVLLVKSLDLNIDNIRFIKEPKASDYFTKVPDDAWYANAFVIAHLNGLPLDKDVDPQQQLTREQFANLLFHALLTKGDYAFNEMYVILKDEKDVNPDYMESIQKLIVSKIAETEDGYFHPKNAITRSEAAKLIHNTIEFVKKVKPIPAIPEEDPNVTMSVEKVNDEVNKVTITWGERPNPGYGISVTGIEFTESGEAIISYRLHEPDPDKFYPQVISEAKTTTFVASSYKPVLRQALDGGSSSSNAGEGVSSSTGIVPPDAPVSSDESQ